MATDEQIKSRPTLNLKQRTFRHELNMYILIYRYYYLLDTLVYGNISPHCWFITNHVAFEFFLRVTLKSPH